MLGESEDIGTTGKSTATARVGRGRSQSATRRITPTTSTSASSVNELLPNGDLYIGGFSSSHPVPHGSGKYLWSDGCMYEGQWRKGKASGKGKLSWPSGAMFEGEFRSGRMEGFGTFTGSTGCSYRGSWSGDKKHGHGEKLYANGDRYEGTWRRNLQDGHGRYVWKNGNEYVGEWRGGVIHGRGTLIWANGNRYDGTWEKGVPTGQGVFTWPDGSCYVGNWSKVMENESGSTKQNHSQPFLSGTFYPGNSNSSENDNSNTRRRKNKDPSISFNRKMTLPLIMDDNSLVAMTKKRSLLDGARRSLIEKNFPRICIWESDGEVGDITCDIIDNFEASMFYRDGTGLDSDEIWNPRRGPCCFNGELKKPGQTISKGHKNYDLMLNLQLGIRYSVGNHASIPRDLKPSDFDPTEKFWTRFPPEGSKITPPHQSAEFRWKDYCPMVFRHLRELFQVDPADYMLAICGNDALRELSSPGKSGSFFYLTQDDRFMIKTVKKSECKVLIKMLSSYYQHVCRYKDSLVTKFFGVHCLKPVGGMKTRFIVMGNFFCSEYRIHRRFDLKGSSHGRTTDKREGEIDETTTLKDLDLNFVFRLPPDLFQKLTKQINRDCEFLEAERIMDYSLLVGVHFRDENTVDKMGPPPFFLRGGKMDSFQNEKFIRGCRFLKSKTPNSEKVSARRRLPTRLGANVPARAEQVLRRSDLDQLGPRREGEIYEVVLYFGIIDILQDYDISKKLEHALKSLQADPTSISAVDPKLYSRRFQDYVRRIFVEDG